METAGILLEKLLSDLKEADDSLPSMNDSSRSTEKVEKILFPDIVIVAASVLREGSRITYGFSGVFRREIILSL